MSKIIKIFFIASMVANSASCSYVPAFDGANVDLDITVVDDLDEPMTNTFVKVAFLMYPVGSNRSSGFTDNDGQMRVSGLTCGEISITVDGLNDYYETNHRFYLWNSDNFSKEWTTKTHKWFDEPVPVKVTVKKMREPVKLVKHGEPYEGLRYPATNEVLGLDLMLYDWCPPYGKGKVADIQVKHNININPADRLDYHEEIDIAMTNCVDGFYWLPVDRSSQMRYAHRVDANANFEKKLSFLYDRKRKKVNIKRLPPEEQYLAIRIRTKVDEDGNIVSANYGFIAVPIGVQLKLGLQPRINPTPNDTNIEDYDEWARIDNIRHFYERNVKPNNGIKW